MGETSPYSKKLFFSSMFLVLFVGIFFSDTAFRIDDPLFLWTAQQIVIDPLDPFGFDVNWFGMDQSMFDGNQNPPLIAYYQALVSLFFGWSERAMHIAFIFPSLICLIAVFFLAERLGSQGGLACLLIAISPGFLLISSTVMCDMWMTAFWCLSCLFWVKGFQENKNWSLLLGAVFSGLAALSKYFALSNPLLLLAYGLFMKRTSFSWLLWLIIPAAMIFGWSIASEFLYGKSHILNAFQYSGSRIRTEDLVGRSMASLSFIGGCSIFPAIMVFQEKWKKSGLIILSGVFLIFLSVGFFHQGIAGFSRSLFLNESLLFSIFGVIGFIVIWKTGEYCLKEFSPESLLIFLWVLGTVFFIAFLNWTVAGRNIVPLIPAVGILVGKVLKNEKEFQTRIWGNPKYVGVLTSSLILALMVTWADSALANTARKASDEITREFREIKGTIRFQGHWGFQYYMQKNKGVPVNFQNNNWNKKDILIIPILSSGTQVPEQNLSLDFLVAFRYLPSPFFTTWNSTAAAGFYSSIYGPLPFSIGRIEPEDYYVLVNL